MRIFATSSKDGSLNLYNLYNGIQYRTLYHPDHLSIDNVSSNK